MLGAEMGAMNGQSAIQKDSNAILNACRDIDEGIDSMAKWLDDLRKLHNRSEDRVGVDQTLPGEMHNLCESITDAYENLINRLKKIMSDPQSGSPRNAPQVGRVQRRLKGAIREYHETQLAHSNRLKSQNERAIRIIYPDATDAEVKEASENPEGPLFTSAVRSHDTTINR
jgi:syntaxin 1B/2/3